MTGTPFEGLLLDSLALVTPSPGADLGAGLSSIRRGGGEGLVIAVLGSLSDTDLDALARFRHHASACVAILLDTATWSSAAPASGVRTHGHTCALLAGSGWRIISAGARSDLRTIWGGAAANASGVPAASFVAAGGLR
jgi:hypothetical protein